MIITVVMVWLFNHSKPAMTQTVIQLMAATVASKLQFMFDTHRFTYFSTTVGWLCTGSPSSCIQVCGNFIRTPAEQCDDGNQ